MIALGAHLRVQQGRYAAGLLAVVEGEAVTATFAIAAPSGDEAMSLSELYRRAHDMIGHHDPGLVVLLASEARDRADLGVARRAEGAVLAAAGNHDCPVRIYKTGGALRKPAGLTGKAPNKETIAAIVSGRVRGLTDEPSEIVYAVAAAFTGARQSSA
jgi:Holliday junction resolvasome RuvABC endonuclease subunit